jgi:sphinganine-1-phosphate aldolase
MSQGESGYIKACHLIVGVAKKIESAIENPALSTDLEICKPLVSVVAFTSTLNVYDMADAMSEGLASKRPSVTPAIHVAVTLPIVAASDKLIEDLVAVVESERKKSG